jgi:2-polyprenyl-6-methoxyphenol hydroxylase-like FAD-dependent oxidoreductase
MSTPHERSVSEHIETEVLVVGAGPTGLLLSGLLARAGVRPRLIERRDSNPQESRALAIVARTLEVFDDIGIAQQVLAQGRPMIAIEAHDGARTVATIEIDDVESPFPFGLCLPQYDTEQLLLAYNETLQVCPEWDTELIGLAQLDGHVEATLRHGDGRLEQLSARYLVGCDGARGEVRHHAEIPQQGRDLRKRFLLADVSTNWDLSGNHLHAFFSKHGAFAAIPMPKNKAWRILAEYDDPGVGEHPDLAVFKQVIAQRTPLDPEVFDPVWTTAFNAYQRRAETFRKGNVLIAGDAAHSHSPIGGQGMNTGLQDAYNLAWKLAMVVNGTAGDSVLDTYSYERTRIADAVLSMTARATTAITLRGAVPRLMRERVVSFVSHFHGPQLQIARSFGELAIEYRNSPLVYDDWSGRTETRLGQPVPRAGDLAPDAFVETSAGVQSIRRVMRGGRHHLLLFAGHVSDAAEAIALGNSVRATLPDYCDASVVTRGPLVDVPGGVLLDQRGQLHTRYGLDEGPATYLVRPDQYIGFRSDRAGVAELKQYFAKNFGS